jgi:hypothetical protein
MRVTPTNQPQKKLLEASNPLSATNRTRLTHRTRNSTDEVKQEMSQSNKNILPAPSCPSCHYARYPATGRCTNFECSRYHRQPGPMTAEQLSREYDPPALFHGRCWGSWTLDTERLCLVYCAFPVALGNGSGLTQGVPPYTAFWGDYEIDLERVRDSAALLDWLYQIKGKCWASARVMKDLLEAFNSIFHPQESLCSGACGNGAGGKTISNPGAFLRNRIATVGNDGPLKDAASGVRL